MLSAVFAEEASERIEKTVSYILEHPTEFTPEAVGADIRDEVIQQLRGGLTDVDISHWSEKCVALIRMGDEKTIAKTMRARKEAIEKVGKSESIGGDGFPVQPLLISFLAEDFFREDGDEWTTRMNDDQLVLSLPISIGSATDVLRLMRKSSVFSPEVKAWLGSADGKFSFRTLDMAKFRSLMRQWWRENESHFAEKDYAAVKPGASLAGVLKPDDTEAPATSQQPPTSPALTGDPSPTTAVATDTQSSPYILPAAVGLSALAIAAAAFVFRRKKSD